MKCKFVLFSGNCNLLNKMYLCENNFQHLMLGILKEKNMFGLFKIKSKKEKLQAKYEKLLKESYNLSTVNRKESDQKAFEAEEVMKMLEKLN